MCVTDADPTTMTNIWNTTFESDQGLNQHAEELPVMWTILGFLAVAFAKAVLSLISILVNKVILTAHTIQISYRLYKTDCDKMSGQYSFSVNKVLYRKFKSK